MRRPPTYPAPGPLLCPLACILAAIGACVPNPRGFDSPVPAARLDAVIDAARHEDRDKIPDLITTLRSDDPAVRLFSIRTLEQLTGETLGYHYADPQRRRDEAVERWIDWYDRTRVNPESSLPQGVLPDEGAREADDTTGDASGSAMARQPE